MKQPVGIARGSLQARVLVAVPIAAVTFAAPAVHAACYVAFVHGSGDNLHDEPQGSRPIEGYWTTGGADASFTHAFADAAGDCTLWQVGYDGNQQWWSDRAAGKVAASLHDFIDKYEIPDGAMTLVGHSMGGVVVRYIINSGAPAAPYYNEYVGWNPRMDYDLVRRKTGRVIAVQSPNTGAQSADALFGQADHGISNTGAGVIKVLGWRNITNATGVMTRPYMEAAGAWGGEMGDEGRELPLYTVSGYESDELSGTGMDDDSKLATAWNLLCYRRGASNSWGAACRWDVWNFGVVPGDGLVEHDSAHGLWLRGSPNGTRGILGARRAWLDLTQNHNHGRYNVHWANVWNHLWGVRTQEKPGRYMGSHLP